MSVCTENITTYYSTLIDMRVLIGGKVKGEKKKRSGRRECETGKKYSQKKYEKLIFLI